jgi:hypothetical protein
VKAVTLLLAVLGLAVIVGACEAPGDQPAETRTAIQSMPGAHGGDVTLVHVRGCDYVVARTYYGIAITHAEDCRNALGHSLGHP